jgi:ABC-type multidrug transport system permease subunit
VQRTYHWWQDWAAWLLVTAGVVILPVSIRAMSRGQSPWQALSRRAVGHEMSFGAGLGLFAAGLALVITMIVALVILAGAVGEEQVHGRRQRRLPFLFLTAVTEREIVLGTLAARAARECPVLLAGMATALLWLGFALLWGVPIHHLWIALWVALAAFGLVGQVVGEGGIDLLQGERRVLASDFLGP